MKKGPAEDYLRVWDFLAVLKTHWWPSAVLPMVCEIQSWCHVYVLVFQDSYAYKDKNM